MSKLIDLLANNPKIVGAILTVLMGLVGASGLKVADSTSQRDDAIDRAVTRVREDIDRGYNMCQWDIEQRLARGEERVVPKLPVKKIERAANEAIKRAVEAK